LNDRAQDHLRLPSFIYAFDLIDSTIRMLGLWLKGFGEECHKVSVTAITHWFERLLRLPTILGEMIRSLELAEVIDLKRERAAHAGVVTVGGLRRPPTPVVAPPTRNLPQ
jgi:hypothetical protein